MQTELRAASRLIEAMAFNRSDAESRITSLGVPLYEHTLKVFLFPDSTFVQGWLREMKEWYYRIQVTGLNIKTKHGKFTANEFHAFLTLDHNHNIKHAGAFENACEVQMRKITRVPHNRERYDAVGPDVLKTRISEFYTQMSQSLANDSPWEPLQATLLHLIKQ